jgi:hypothetical protein
LTRQSAIRILKACATELNLKINIIESEDGIETIFIAFKAMSIGLEIKMIISDENMIFLNGTKSSQILYDLAQKQRKDFIPFYLLTAYENEDLKSNLSKTIKNVISKPLNKYLARKLLENP